MRRATTYEEQNLVVMEHGEHLYYVSTKNILPKQELMVGYSNSYAKKYGFHVLQQPIEELWHCFECNNCFETSEALQKHLNVHDNELDENTKPRKSLIKKRLLMRNRTKASPVKCLTCNEIFVNPKYNLLRQHLLTHGLDENDLLKNFVKIRY